MDENYKAILISIHDNITNHPISKMFSCGCAKEEQKGITLNEIKHNIEAGKYMNIKEWENDMHDIINNKNITNDKYNDIIKKEFLKILEKEKKVFDLFANPSKWCESLINLNDREINLSQNSPREIKNVINSCVEFRKMIPMRRMSEKELSNFKKATLLLKTEEEQNGMLKIITDLQPEAAPEIGQSNVWVDITRLNYNTFDELIKYIKGVLQKKGISYPE